MNEQSGKPQPAAAPQQQVSKAAFKRIAECQSLGEALQTRELMEAIARAVPKHMDPDTMLRACIEAAKSNNGLMYQASMKSALGMFMSLSYLGLPPNTPNGWAYVIPFRSQKWNPATRQKEPGVDLNLIIGYRGYIELAHRNDVKIESGLVFPGDQFMYERGHPKVFRHVPNTDIATAGLVPRCAYALAYFPDNDYIADVMSWPDVLAIRDRSQAYRTAMAAFRKAEDEKKRPPPTYTEAPWVKDEHEMGRKTPVRRLAKYLPKCPELRAAVALEDAQERTRLDWGPVIDGTATPMTGIPEASDDAAGEEGSGGVDPGAAFGTRTNEPAQQPAKPARRKAEPAAAEPPAEARPVPRDAPPQKAGPAAAEPPRKPPQRPSFEAVFVSADGEVGENFTDPDDFARAIVARCGDAFPPDRVAIIEHNADAIEEARNVSDAAARILAVLDDQDEQLASDGADGDDDPDEAYAPLPVAVPVERGKESWQGWARGIKEECATLDMARLPVWIDTQRETAMRAPLSPRLVALKAIHNRCVHVGIVPPPWLGEAAKAGQPKAEPPAEAPPAAAGQQRDRDAEWSEYTIREVIDAATVHDVDEIADRVLVRAVMQRLKRDRPQLFARVDRAFVDKLAMLRRAPEGPGDGA